MTKSETIKCNAIIHAAATSAALVGAGLAQLPVCDNAALVPIQTTMIIIAALIEGVCLLTAIVCMLVVLK